MAKMTKKITPPSEILQFQWIPVSTRLPKPSDGGKFLVTRQSSIDTYIDILYYGQLQFEKSKKKAFYFYDDECGDVEVDNVTAWAPLPSPYNPLVARPLVDDIQTIQTTQTQGD